MLKRINQTKELLESLLKTHNLNDQAVLEVSQKLDKLILEYYTLEYRDVNSYLSGNIHKTSVEKVI